MHPNTTEKPTLMQLRRAHNDTHPGQALTSQQIADLAGVPLSAEYALEIGGHAVNTEQAERILSAFSTLTGCTRTLHDIRSHLVTPSQRLTRSPHKTQLL